MCFFTETEKKECMRLINSITKLNNIDKKEILFDEVMRTTYSIGGGYTEDVLKKVIQSTWKTHRFNENKTDNN